MRSGPTPTRTGTPRAAATSRRWRSRSEVRARKRMMPMLEGRAEDGARGRDRAPDCRREPNGWGPGASMTWVAVIAASV